MPYLKPAEMIALLQTVTHSSNKGDVPEYVDTNDLGSAVVTCPICGTKGCDKSIVKANGVYVHPEDVGNAEEIEINPN